MVRILLPVIGEECLNYRRALSALGAEAVLTAATVDPEGFDGLLLPGGGDVAPARYGQENDGSFSIDEALDALQIDLFLAFMVMGKPILGICRGIQVINVALGGTLVQDIRTGLIHSRTGETDSVHPITAAEGSILGELYGQRFSVNSSHHQAVGIPGRGFRVTARSDDGTAEAAEHETLPILGVQFHPERMCFSHLRPDTVDGSVLLRRFIDRCK
ncbi:MAG: gamma-glutamyl-gamma-aminobutyrate hydrolase family protein [Oscillospiraceae bacterium]|nr:gamma-glutamyl-gamma-aminobutyrate hydrolase family protein [Oscillospiraceae bacterium]